MLPTIDFTQQLSQIQAQLQNMNKTSYTPQAYSPATQTDPKLNCQYRLPCGLCSKTDSFCCMPTEEVKTNE